MVVLFFFVPSGVSLFSGRVSPACRTVSGIVHANIVPEVGSSVKP